MITTLVPSPFLFPLSAVITPPTETIGNAGDPRITFPSGSITVRANLQPVSSRDSMQYGRETGVDLYELFIQPTDTSGAAVTLTNTQIKNCQIVVNGRTLKALGGKMDPITNGALYSITCEEVY